MRKELHAHICEDGNFHLWEHDDATCSHGKVFICDACAAVRRAQYNQGKAWAEMARDMPIPHTHKCVICENEWGHNDKKCAIEEQYWLECEVCMTFTFTHPCPKCGTASEEVAYGPYNVTRYVCPKCRHYFVPPEQEIYAAEAHVCPGCGKEAKKVESASGSVCYTCSDCQYFFYGEGQGNSEQDKADVCPQCGTRVTSDVCPECGYHILLDRDGADEYDTGAG